MSVGRPRRSAATDNLPGRITLVLAAAALSATLLPAQTTGPATERIPEAPGHLEWTRDMQIVLGIGFGFPDSEVKLDRWMADCDFDFVDWCLPGHLKFSDHLRSHYGVGASGADYQWSEFWEFEFPRLGDVNPSTFVDDVICATIEGQRSSDMYQGTSRKFRRFSTCANRPRWREYRTARDLELLPHFSAVNVDVMRAWNRAQAFCPDCQQVFRDFLRARFTPAQLQTMGVTDVATFDFSAHLKARHPGKPEPGWLDDPLVRGYLRAQTLAQLGHLRDFAATMRTGGGKLGRGMPVFGNTGHILWAAANDLIELEIDPSTAFYGYPDARRGVTRIKQALAFGGYDQPVWVRGYARIVGNTADFERTFQDLMLGEAFANGAVRVLDLNQEDAPASPAAFEQRGYFYRRFIDFARLIQTHRAALQDRDNAAEVALVYSLPTEWYESGGPFRFGNSQHLVRVQGWAKALDESHLPYEMVVFGHPEFRPDRDDLLARLHRYRTVILPGAASLTDAQIAAVRRYVAEGGSLVWSGQPGVFDENREPRPAPPLADLPGENFRRPAPGAGRVAGLADHDLAYGTAVSENRAPDAAEFYRMKQAVLWSIGGERQILHTDASPETQFNLWLARNRRSASLHLVNYGVDLARDYARPQHDIRVSLRLPRELEAFDRVTVVAPGEPDREVPFTRTDDEINFTVPKLNVWAMVVFSAGREQDAATALANSRKTLRRQVILGREIGAHLPRYEAAFAQYTQRNYTAALDQATTLTKNATSAHPISR